MRDGDGMWYRGDTATYDDYPCRPGSCGGCVAGYSYVDTGNCKHGGAADVAIDYYGDPVTFGPVSHMLYDVGGYGSAPACGSGGVSDGGNSTPRE